MRTVTFADEKVRGALKDYALAWKNIKDEPCAGSSFRHDTDDEAVELMRGIGNHNVQILFLTAKLEILHALAGYWGPKDLARELALVAKLAKAGTKEKIVELHKEHAAEDKKEMGSGSCGMMDEKTMKWLEDTR